LLLSVPIIEPIWAGPSLRTIFINKNIVGYCGYIGLISFVAYRPDKPLADSALAVPPQFCGTAQSVTHIAADGLITP